VPHTAYAWHPDAFIREGIPVGSVVLTATSRLARELVRLDDSGHVLRGQRGWSGAGIVPFRSWIVGLWREWLYSDRPTSPPILLRSPAELSVWEEVIRQASGDSHVSDWGRTADAALEAWNLAWMWSVPLDGVVWGETEDTEAFCNWSQEFRSRLRSQGWLSTAELPSFVSDCVRRGEISLPPEIRVVGFDELPPAYRNLLDAAAKCGSQIEIETRIEDRTEGFSTRRPESMGFHQPESEVRASAVWARRVLSTRLKAKQARRSEAVSEFRIGIVVPGLDRSRDLVERVFRETFDPGGTRVGPDHSFLPYNISAGPPLAHYPIVEAAIQILRFHPVNATLEDVGRLLRSPFVGGAQEELTGRALLARALARRREPRVSVGAVIDLGSDVGAPWSCPQLIGHLVAWKAICESLPERQSPSDWAQAISRLLRAAGWPGGRSQSSAEHQTIGAWQEILREMASLDSVVSRIPGSEAVSTLQRLARSRQFQPESEPRPIQILGLLEAGGLRFDYLWVMDMDAASWPRAVDPNPFIPRVLQRSCGLPASSPERVLDSAKRLAARLLSSVEPGGDPEGIARVVVSHVREESEPMVGPTPLFGGLREVDPEFILPGSAGTLPDRWEQVFRSARIEVIEDAWGPPWKSDPGRTLPGGTEVFANQAACPFRAFARARLRTGIEPTPVHGLDSVDRGQLVHEVLERVWGDVGSHENLIRLPENGLARLIRSAAEGAVGGLARNREMLSRPVFARIESRRLEVLVRRWLELEKQRRGFRVIGREVRSRIEVAGLPLVVRVDRIDEIDDGGRILIDYKTGSPAPGRWEGDRPEEPQLPIYATQLEQASNRLAGVLYGVVRKDGPVFRGITREADIVPGVEPRPGSEPLDVLLSNWSQVLERLGREFREGKADVDPRDGARTCRYCNLQSLCRIHESPGEVDETPGAEA